VAKKASHFDKLTGIGQKYNQKYQARQPMTLFLGERCMVEIGSLSTISYAWKIFTDDNGMIL
jgi:hypothetical protein